MKSRYFLFLIVIFCASMAHAQAVVNSDSFNIVRRGVREKIDQETLSQAVARHLKNLDDDFKKIDSLLADSSQAAFFAKTQFDDLNLKATGIKQGPPIALSYGTAVSAACRNAKITFDTSPYLNLKKYLKEGKIEIRAYQMIASCAQIDQFPNVVITDAYAAHLMYLIEEILKTFPKFQTTVADYNVMETGKHFTLLRDKIYYRISFIKYCYAKI